MTERLVNSILWATVMSLVFLIASGALLVGYFSLYQLAELRWRAGTIGIAIALACLAITVKLARHREDLV